MISQQSRIRQVERALLALDDELAAIEQQPKLSSADAERIAKGIELRAALLRNHPGRRAVFTTIAILGAAAILILALVRLPHPQFRALIVSDRIELGLVRPTTVLPACSVQHLWANGLTLLDLNETDCREQGAAKPGCRRQEHHSRLDPFFIDLSTEPSAAANTTAISLPDIATAAHGVAYQVVDDATLRINLIQGTLQSTEVGIVGTATMRIGSTPAAGFTLEDDTSVRFGSVADSAEVRLAPAAGIGPIFLQPIRVNRVSFAKTLHGADAERGDVTLSSVTLSSVRSGRFEFPAVPSASATIARYDWLTLAGVDANVRSLAISGDRLSIEIEGVLDTAYLNLPENVPVNGDAIDLRPTWLDWILARKRTAAIAAAIAYVLSLLKGASSWLSSSK